MDPEETDSLSDDLFNAAFDETVKGEVTPEVKAEPEVKVEPEVVVPPVAEQVVTPPIVEPPAPIDVKAIVAEAVAAATKKEAPIVETPSGPTPEELAAEEQYKKDWPEQYAREQRLKAQLDEVKTLLATTTEALKGQIAPAIESANATAEEKHLATIYKAHADADAILPNVEKWVSEQPKFLQPQYNAVLERGSAAEIVELFDTYKKFAGVTAPADTSAADAEAARLEAEKTDRLKRMTGVTSIRTSVTAEEDADDFDSAFEAEAKKYKIAA